MAKLVGARVWQYRLNHAHVAAPSIIIWPPWTGNDARTFVLDDDQIDGATAAADPTLAEALRYGSRCTVIAARYADASTDPQRQHPGRPGRCERPQ